MSEPSPEELSTSLNELYAYRDRLQKEVSTISKKLRMPNPKVSSGLSSNEELQRVDDIILKLKSILRKGRI